eukprot:TRINITY_DN65918_c0_g1_i1.p1 TRINITY_DN65918_c0_g1~~TRINITY_DN65918_c0_g1_i1.p1  ORF type:complete len:301 (+),score=64.62 TRINITY_DN65918_c0_g1_i1:63-905(+)
MADSGGEGAVGSGDNGQAPADGQPRRARRNQGEVQEVVDELTLETKRTTLLDQVEAQLKPNQVCVPQVSRLLFAFSVADDRKLQGQVDKEFLDWRQQQGGSDLTGVLLYVQQAGVHFLEGPTSALFEAFTFFNTLAQETSERAALVSNLKVLHFTEMKGVRCSVGWCSQVQGGKLQGQGMALDDSNCSELAFTVYSKLLLLCLKVQDAFPNQDASVERLAAQYRRYVDQMPLPEDMQPLMSKASAEFYMTYPEFHEVFVAPFNCVLHSELLWPIPPSLAY